MNILIVDDEELARLRLRRLLDGLPDNDVVGEAVNGQEAWQKIRSLAPDLVLLDVRMPGMDGIELARQLADLDDPPAIVFCSAYDEYALDAFDTLAQGYLMKPVQLEQLQRVIEKTKRLSRVQHQIANQHFTSEQLDSSQECIVAKSARGMDRIPLNSVFCFVADHKYVTVLHQQGETLIDDTLKELEHMYADRFVRVHRNALVNISKIQGLLRDADGHYVVRLQGSDYRPDVSRRHLSALKTRLQQR